MHRNFLIGIMLAGWAELGEELFELGNNFVKGMTKAQNRIEQQAQAARISSNSQLVKSRNSPIMS